jgi:SAM-dependent methyltransferase
MGIEADSQNVWAYHGMFNREHFPAIIDITRQMKNPGSTWKAQGMDPPNYMDQMVEAPERAALFTRMLYELHLEMAEDCANILDIGDKHRLIDIGGGSGVMAFALLKKFPQLSAVVVDLENVCATGRQIAAENNLSNRITYRVANFLEDSLPKGFDLALECDLDIHNEDVFQKIHASLNSGGCFVIVDQFAPVEGFAPPLRLLWEFRDSLDDPHCLTNTIEKNIPMLGNVGFDVTSVRGLTGGWTVIESIKRLDI